MGGPLKGLRVLDFTRAMAGPFATLVLGDLGADIIKIEPLTGDETRGWRPPEINGVSAYFLSVNRNKRSIAINLKHPESRKIIERLVKTADVVIENFRPGTARKLGIDYDTLRKINDRIIYCSISGYGQDGPYRDKPGYDLTVMAMSGLMSITGEPGRPPVKFGVPITDITTGMFAAIAILAALHYRSVTGEGQYIDMSMLDSQLLILSHQAFNYFATGRDPKRLGSAHPSIAPYQVFETMDGYIAVGVGSEKLWSIFTRVIGREDLEKDPRFETNDLRVKNREELVKELTKTFKTKTTEEWYRLLDQAGIPAAPVKKVSEILNDPHVLYRKMVIEIEHPVYGRIKSLGTPFKMSKTPGEIRIPPPLLGEHTNEILKELGFSDSEISELRESGVVK